MPASRTLYRNLAHTIRQEVTTGTMQASAVRALADDLKRDNSSFRYDRFFQACGLDEYGEHFNSAYVTVTGDCDSQYRMEGSGIIWHCGLKTGHYKGGAGTLHQVHGVSWTDEQALSEEDRVTVL